MPSGQVGQDVTPEADLEPAHSRPAHVAVPAVIASRRFSCPWRYRACASTAARRSRLPASEELRALLVEEVVEPALDPQPRELLERRALRSCPLSPPPVLTSDAPLCACSPRRRPSCWFSRRGFVYRTVPLASCWSVLPCAPEWTLPSSQPRDAPMMTRAPPFDGARDCHHRPGRRPCLRRVRIHRERSSCGSGTG